MTQEQMYAGESRPTYRDETVGSGWITFAGVMLMVVATLNIIDGIAAISNSKFFIDDASYILSGLNTWGWIVLVIGVAQVFVAFGVWAGNQLARWLGVAIASVNVVAQLMFIPSYPFWALAIFSLDILVIYGLVAHGGRPSFR